MLDIKNKLSRHFNKTPPCASFVAGTLVHTDKGLVPIQDIKVGDKVLSRDEHNPNGELAYKKVLSIFKSPKKEKLYKVEYHSHCASDRGENSLNYIFCTDNHLFWRSLEPNDAQGEWTTAEDLFGGYLNSAHGDALELSDFSFMPVRTLPNFPQGCAYVQSLEHMTDDWNDTENVEFVQFKQNGYQFVCLADNEEESKDKLNEMSLDTSDSIWHLSQSSPFTINLDLYSKLNIRLRQDTKHHTHTSEKFAEYMNEPIMEDGEVICQNRIGNHEAYERTLRNIALHGDDSGLTETSLHNNVEHYYGEEYPNSYSDHVYNLEVEDYHTYFVGPDAVWAHNTNCRKQLTPQKQ